MPVEGIKILNCIQFTSTDDMLLLINVKDDEVSKEEIAMVIQTITNFTLFFFLYN